MKLVLVALIVFMSIGVTLSASLLDQFGIEKNYLLVGLGAFVITGLVAFRGMALIVIILFMSLAINMPEEVLAQYYLDKDILIAAIILMVIFPLVYRGFVGGKS
jgi:hypothetical protein